jgi:ribonuclease R
LKWALQHPDAAPPTFIKPAIGEEASRYSQKHLEEIAAETSETERRAANAERELLDWKTAQYMEQRLGDEFDGLIISVQKYGCFVELFDIFVEGLLPINALEEAAGARCVYRERDHAIVGLPGGDRDRRGRRGKKPAAPLEWKLGDRVRVRAERIDPMRHRVEFALVTPA